MMHMDMVCESEFIANSSLILCLFLVMIALTNILDVLLPDLLFLGCLAEWLI